MSVKPAEVLHIGGHEVNITRPEKVLFLEDGITKEDLMRYYQRISPWRLPHLERRPLAMRRFPDGVSRSCGDIRLSTTTLCRVAITSSSFGSSELRMIVFIVKSRPAVVLLLSYSGDEA
jgi:hypothetical protein